MNKHPDTGRNVFSCNKNESINIRKLVLEMCSQMWNGWLLFIYGGGKNCLFCKTHLWTFTDLLLVIKNGS